MLNFKETEKNKKFRGTTKLISCSMSTISDQKKYSGKWFSPNDIEQIKQIISNNPQAFRALLSRLVCQELNWKKIDGNLMEMSCRVAMLGMERDNLIRLPEPLYKKNPVNILKKEHPGERLMLAKYYLIWKKV